LIIAGNKLWNDSVTAGLHEISVSQEKKLFLFEHVPDTLYDALINSVNSYPDKIAVVDDIGMEYTFAQLLRLTDRFAGALCKKGVTLGSHVGVLLYTSIEFCITFLALSRLGAICIPFPTKYKKTEIFSLVSKSDLEFMVCDSTFKPWFQSTKFSVIVSERVHDDELGFAALSVDPKLPEHTKCHVNRTCDALIVFTSGTTSESKGVVLTNYNIMHAIVVYQRIFTITDNDSCIIPIPMYLITGLVALFGLFVYVGGTIYLQKFFNATRILACIKQHGITFMHASPTVFFLLLEESRNHKSLPSLRELACGSSNMPVSKIREIHQWLPNCIFHTVYGLTETTSPAAIFPYDAASSKFSGSCGLPIPGTVFKVVDEKDKELDYGMIGEIMIKGSVVVDHYYKLNGNYITADGWLHTGDLGYFNENNYLYIVDRKKDMINRGGEKICSIDVENELYKIKGIKEAAIIGIPDCLYGEVPIAIVSLSEPLTEEQIIHRMSDQVAKYKVPVKVFIVPSIPKSANGKVDKKKLRDEYAAFGQRR
jgi:fatty-acyl-CoA synthase/long-chain acyl-CoA synthetase